MEESTRWLSRTLRIVFTAGAVGFLLWEMGALLDVAVVLPIDYLDSFEYLANARILAEQDTHAIEIGYRWRRPPLVSLAQALVYPSGGDLDAALAGFRAAHLLAWVLSVSALGALFFLLTRALSATLAVLGVVLVAANPMFLHLVPFALVDIPAMFTTTLALAFYLVARGSKSFSLAAVAGLALGAAMATKYTLLLLVPCLVLFEGVDAWARRAPSPLRAALSARTILICASAGVFWSCLQAALRIHVDGSGFEALPKTFVTLMGEFDYVGVLAGWDDPLSEYVQELFQVTPIALMLAFGIGAVLSIRSGTAADRLHLVWLVVFLLVMSFGIQTKASRYLLPALPSLIHLQLRGLAWAHERFRLWLVTRTDRKATRGAAYCIGTAAALGTVLWLPLAQAREQVTHFEDPVYEMTFVEHLVRQIDNDVPRDRPLFWRGAFYSVYPVDPVFFPHDEAFYFYHLARPTLEFFLNRPVEDWESGRPYHSEDLVEILQRDGAIVTNQDRFHLTHLADQLPSSPVPLRLDVIDRRTFLATGASPLVLKDPYDARRQIRLERTPEGYRLPREISDQGWLSFARAQPEARPEAFDGALTRPPHAIELLRVHRSEFRYRN